MNSLLCIFNISQEFIKDAFKPSSFLRKTEFWRRTKREVTTSQKGSICLYSKSGFGLNEVIGIAAGIIIAVVIVIPGLQVFAANVLAQLTNWWNGMAADIFN